MTQTHYLEGPGSHRERPRKRCPLCRERAAFAARLRVARARSRRSAATAEPALQAVVARPASETGRFAIICPACAVTVARTDDRVLAEEIRKAAEHGDVDPGDEPYIEEWYPGTLGTHFAGKPLRNLREI